ncbi:RyR domain-containing protein [Cryptosporangium phraense]|uniref:Ryanodine receptor Ryr domain-containing protein n=1 Tax=Cryptosporangium phraense TaxID=2593070 RepID=A0A545B013_9ACTN|nr:RyR domain-containing protein [Cryptosporangium phraense]TQS46912.1 hypothetical protein FL583_01145 [Cryptosporangium phraense]
MTTETDARLNGGVAVSFPVRVGVGLAAIAAFVLGFVGLPQHIADVNRAGGGFRTSVVDVLYYDLQMFVLDSDPVEAGATLPVTLQIARFLAPATAAYLIFVTAQSVIARQLEAVRARTARGHAVVFGSEPAVGAVVAGLLADPAARRRWRRSRRRRVVLVAREAPSAADLLRHVRWIPGNPWDAAALRRARAHVAAEVFALSDDGTANAQAAVVVANLLADIPGRQKGPVFYGQIDDESLYASLIAREISHSDDLRLELFNPLDRIARRLLATHPPDTSDGTPLVAVVADGPIVGTMLGALAGWWRAVRAPAGPALDVRVLDVPALDGPALDVRVLDPTGDGRAWTAATHTTALRVGAAPFDRGIRELAAERAARTPAVPTFVYVFAGSDNEAIRRGAKVRSALHDARRAPHVVVAVTTPGISLDLVTTAAAGDSAGDPARRWISLFNVTNEVYALDDLRLGAGERMARAIHDAYVRACAARGETVETNPSMAPWDRLSPDLLASNRAQAADLGPKLRSIGCVLAPTTTNAEPFAYQGDELERLARLEHDRWVRSRTSLGWTFGERRDAVSRQHPDLVSWDELGEAAKGLDRQAVAAIPLVVETVGLQVVRLEPGAGTGSEAGPSPLAEGEHGELSRRVR